MHAAGFWMMFNGMPILGLLTLGVVQGRCGWFMHEGGHHSLTGNILLDHAIQVFFYGTGCGMSGAFWRNQHNKHHATPQKIGHDVDLDTLPLVMFHMSVKDGKQGHMLKSKLGKFNLNSIFFSLFLLYNECAGGRGLGGRGEGGATCPPQLHLSLELVARCSAASTYLLTAVTWFQLDDVFVIFFTKIFL